MKYGYARVSTAQQDLEAQIQSLEKEGCDKIYAEKYTGTKADRPKFLELLSILQEGDTLVVTKLDRFARSTADAITTIKALFGVPSEKCGFTTIRICKILCNIVTNAAITKTRSIHCWDWLCRIVYKILYKQCYIRKGGNVDLTTFPPFYYVPKL